MQYNKYWIWLSRIEGLGNIRKNKLLEIYKTPEAIWNLEKNEILKIDGFGIKIADKILDKRYKENLDKFIQYMEKYNIKMINIIDKEYPEKLKDIYDPPITLYVKGNIKILNSISVGIVGCRECSDYGKEIASSFAYNLANKNIAIVSGMAKGIDSYAHVGCARAKGKNIAVLGCGLDRIYPKENIGLYNNILQNDGVIVSEYVIGTEVTRMNFPARNRIISGLSNGILVVEAKEKSGALITVDFAIEQGKDVFVIPGNITSINSFGTNELIKQGAKCVTNVDEILEEII